MISTKKTTLIIIVALYALNVTKNSAFENVSTFTTSKAI